MNNGANCELVFIHLTGEIIMQTIDRTQIQNVIAQLSAIMQTLMPPERRTSERRNGADQAHQAAPKLAEAHQPTQAAPALAEPTQAAPKATRNAKAPRPVAMEWPLPTYAAPARPFPGFLWPYELKKMSKARRDEYNRKLTAGEIGPDTSDQGTAPGETAPGKTPADQERAATLAKFSELDKLLADGGEDGKPLEIDFGTHSPAYQAIMINCLNKGMPTRAAHNFAAKKAYGEKAILY